MNYKVYNIEDLKLAPYDIRYIKPEDEATILGKIKILCDKIFRPDINYYLPNGILVHVLYDRVEENKIYYYLLEVKLK